MARGHISVQEGEHRLASQGLLHPDYLPVGDHQPGSSADRHRQLALLRAYEGDDHLGGLIGAAETVINTLEAGNRWTQKALRPSPGRPTRQSVQALDVVAPRIGAPASVWATDPRKAAGQLGSSLTNPYKIGETAAMVLPVERAPALAGKLGVKAVQKIRHADEAAKVAAGTRRGKAAGLDRPHPTHMDVAPGGGTPERHLGSEWLRSQENPPVEGFGNPFGDPVLYTRHGTRSSVPYRPEPGVLGHLPGHLSQGSEGGRGMYREDFQQARPPGAGGIDYLVKESGAAHLSDWVRKTLLDRSGYQSNILSGDIPAQNTPGHVPAHRKLDPETGQFYNFTHSDPGIRQTVPYQTGPYGHGPDSQLTETNPGRLFGQWIQDHLAGKVPGGPPTIPRGVYSANLAGNQAAAMSPLAQLLMALYQQRNG